MHFKTMRRKQNLASDFGIQKENWGEIMHFSEIIKLQFGKKHHTLLCILLLFRIIKNCRLVISKKCVVTPNFLKFGFQYPLPRTAFPA